MHLVNILITNLWNYFPINHYLIHPSKNIVCDSLVSAQAQYDMLFEHGIFVSYLRYPTVSQPTLRISLSYFHDTDDIDRLFNVMKQYDEGDSYV